MFLLLPRSETERLGTFFEDANLIPLGFYVCILGTLLVFVASQLEVTIPYMANESHLRPLNIPTSKSPCVFSSSAVNIPTADSFCVFSFSAEPSTLLFVSLISLRVSLGCSLFSMSKLVNN
jgi:hypothetical protein